MFSASHLCKILIAENEAIIAESLYQVILELGFQPYEPAGTTNEAIERINNTAADLAIVDIHTGNNFSGFKVAEVLNNKNIPFIFIINQYNKQTLTMAQQLNPFAYLVKPFTKEHIQAAISQVVNQQALKYQQAGVLPQQVFIKDGHKSINLSPSEITYLQADDKYITIYLSTGKKYLVRGPLSSVISQLQLSSLVQVHKSFVINTVHIKAVKYDELFIKNSLIPIGRTYRDELKKKLLFI
jgi:two-component system, LytTR family, response regulator LytT